MIKFCGLLYCLLQIDENVQREIINHRSLRHPNIVRFKEVSLFLHFVKLKSGIKRYDALIAFVHPNL
jgi:hypothetical protein